MRIAKRSGFITTSRTSSTSSGWTSHGLFLRILPARRRGRSTRRSRRSSSTSAASCCLKPGERFLDIGCGWGALVIHAARHHGVRAHGITLSEQPAGARTRAHRGRRARGSRDRRAARLSRARPRGLCTTRWRASACSSTWASRICRVYFATVQRVLTPDGLFLNHGITHEHAGWQPQSVHRVHQSLRLPRRAARCNQQHPAHSWSMPTSRSRMWKGCARTTRSRCAHGCGGWSGAMRVRSST